MSTTDEVREALIDMGVDPAKSHAASTMFGSVDAAINWVFGEGENWKPSDGDVLPDYNTAAPQRPPSPAYLQPNTLPPPPFGSNNPFAQQVPQRAPLPPPPPPPPDAGDSEERRVRASAPPPSPGVEKADPLDGVPFFGPTNKDDPDNKLAVALPSAPAVSNSNKEEEDFQRAIQESMMTASFHSTGSVAAEELPPATERELGQPLVYATLKHPQTSVQSLQALAAVPQLRDVLASINWEVDDPRGDMRKEVGTELEEIQQLFKLQDTERASYELVDPTLDRFKPEWNNSSNPTVYGNFTNIWLHGLLQALIKLGRNKQQLIDFGRDVVSDWQQGPEQLIATTLHAQPHTPHPYVTFERGFNQPANLHAALSALIWGPSVNGGSGEGVQTLGDVQFVQLNRTPGIPAPQWDIDECIVLDRYLYHNRKWVAQVRAEQSMAEADLARLREKVESLSNYKGNNIADAIQTLVKHLANSPASDSMKNETRTELKLKLEKIAENLNEKTKRLQEEITEKEHRVSGTLFETTDPERMQHRYFLRAVMWHDGFMTPGKHLYSYVKHGDQWWKVEGVEATKAAWDGIKTDTTGQFTDGGPYMLIYSREGLRPVQPPPSPVAPTTSSNAGGWDVQSGAPEESSTLIDIDDDGTSGDGARLRPLSPAAPSGLEALMDADEEEIKLAPGTTVTAVPVRSRRNTLESEALSRETTREGAQRSTITRQPTVDTVMSPPSRQATLDGVMRSPSSRKSTHDTSVRSPTSRRSTLEGARSPSSRKSTLEGARSPSSRKSTLEGARSPSSRKPTLSPTASRKATHDSGSVVLSPSRKTSASVDTTTHVLSPSRKGTHDIVTSPIRQNTDETDKTVRETKREADGDTVMQ